MKLWDSWTVTGHNHDGMVAGTWLGPLSLRSETSRLKHLRKSEISDLIGIEHGKLLIIDHVLKTQHDLASVNSG